MSIVAWPFTQPAIVTLSGNNAKLYELMDDGAPGPAYVDGVKGDWVLVGQGYGYQVFNYQTHVLDRSDQYANPGKSTKLY